MKYFDHIQPLSSPQLNVYPEGYVYNLKKKLLSVSFLCLRYLIPHVAMEALMWLPRLQNPIPFLFVCLFCFVFRDRVSLCSPGCPGTHSVDQAGLELRNPPASASQVLGLKVNATTAQLDAS